MKDSKQILKDADEKVQLFLDLHNLDNETWQRLRWGYYIVYTFYHPEGFFEELVTFADKEEAEAYLQTILDDWNKDPLRDVDPTPALFEVLGQQGGYLDTLGIHDIESVKEYHRIRDWDEPIRRGLNLNASRSVGLANSFDFVNALPIEMLKDLMIQFFDSNLIPGYYDE